MDGIFPALRSIAANSPCSLSSPVPAAPCRSRRAEILASGDELTSGQRLDTNGQWLSTRLGELGIRVMYHTTVADDLAANVRVFQQAVQRADVVVATGGLGPTADDLTREALAIYVRHLKPDGVIAFQATNRFVDIAPVVERLAAEFGMTAVMITDYPSNANGDEFWLSSTDQILVTRNPAILRHERVAAVAEPIKRRPGFPVWTDDFNNLLTVLK